MVKIVDIFIQAERDVNAGFQLNVILWVSHLTSQKFNFMIYELESNNNTNLKLPLPQDQPQDKSSVHENYYDEDDDNEGQDTLESKPVYVCLNNYPETTSTSQDYPGYSRTYGQPDYCRQLII